MPKIPRILGPSVQQRALPQPFDTADTGGIARGAAAVGRGLEHVGEYFQQQQQRANEREFAAKRLEAEGEFSKHEHGHKAENNPAWSSDDEEVDGWRDRKAEKARGLTDGTEEYEGVLPSYDKAVSKIADQISNGAVRERFLEWAAKNRLQTEMRARQYEDSEGEREMRELGNAAIASAERNATNEGMLDNDFGNQQRQIQSDEEEIRKMLAPDHTDEYIEEVLISMRERIRETSLNLLLEAERPDAARRYFTDYGHELDSRARARLRGRINAKEDQAKLDDEVTGIINALALDGRRITEDDEALRTQKIEELRETGEYTSAELVQIDGFVQHRMNQSEKQAAKRDAQTSLAALTYLFENNTLKGFEGFETLPEARREQLLEAERRIQQALTKAGNEIPAADSIRSLQTAMTDPRWAEDPLGVAIDYAGTMNDKYLSILMTEARAQMDGKPPGLFKSGSDMAVSYLRHLYGEKGKSDAEMEDKYGAELLKINEELQKLPPGTDVNMELIRGIALGVATKAEYDPSFSLLPNQRTVKLHELTQAEIEKINSAGSSPDLMLDTDVLDRGFSGWRPQSAVKGDPDAILSPSQAVLKTTKEFIHGRNTSKEEGVGAPTDNEVNAALAKALRGEDEELYAAIETHRANNDVPQDGAYTTAEKYSAFVGELKGGPLVAAKVAESRKTLSDMLVAIAASPVFVPFTEEELPGRIAKAQSLGYDTEKPGVMLAFTLMSRAGEKMIEGMEPIDAYVSLGLTPEQAGEWLAMGEKVFGAIPEVRHLEARLEAAHAQRQAIKDANEAGKAQIRQGSIHQ